MVRYKGQIKILDVFQDCPGVLVLVGDGPEREPIKVRVDELGLKDRVRILPFTRDVSPIYAGSDVFVMSSGPQEGLVLVVLEAMSCGLPVLALRTPAMEQVIDHGVTGILMDHLSELPVILKTLSTGDLHQLGVSARSKVQSDHTALAMTRKVEAIYREVLAAKRYRAPRIKKVGGPPH
jgi:glycosyltransferase involved in cell wall biosynthesis